MSADYGVHLARDLESIQGYLQESLSDLTDEAAPPNASTPVARRLISLIRAVQRRNRDSNGEQLISRILEDAGQAFWLWDLENGQMRFSPGWCQATGMPEQVDSQDIEPWLEHVLPGDRVRLMAAVRDHLAGSSKRLQIDYRLQRSDGETRWFRCTGRCERNATGTPVRLGGIQRDITRERREPQREMKSIRQPASRGRTADLVQSALDHGGVVPFFQPIVDLRTRELVGMEALVRIHDKTRGVIMPREFLATAERSDLIVRLGDRVLELSLRGLAAARGAGKLGTDTFMSVNLSGRQLLDANLPDRIQAALREASLPPESLQLELTETVLVSNIAFARRTLSKLRHAGIRIALDDFGAGYSSLSYLQDLPIDALKVDRRFVRHVDRNQSRNAILRTIVALAETLNLPIIAEGVETEAEAAELRNLGLPLAQGYLFSKPAPLSVQLAMLSEPSDGRRRTVTQI